MSEKYIAVGVDIKDNTIICTETVISDDLKDNNFYKLKTDYIKDITISDDVKGVIMKSSVGDYQFWQTLVYESVDKAIEIVKSNASRYIVTDKSNDLLVNRKVMMSKFLDDNWVSSEKAMELLGINSTTTFRKVRDQCQFQKEKLGFRYFYNKNDMLNKVKEFYLTTFKGK